MVGIEWRNVLTSAIHYSEFPKERGITKKQWVSRIAAIHEIPVSKVIILSIT